MAWAAMHLYRGTLNDTGGMRSTAGRVDGKSITCLLIGRMLVLAWTLL